MRSFRVSKENYIKQNVEKSSEQGRILHVGCTNSPNTRKRFEHGNLLHKTICESAQLKKSRVIGIDIDEEAVKYLQIQMPEEDIICLDAHHLASVFKDAAKFNLIIAGDVIEHLPNPGLFVESCRDVLLDDGVLIITTTNAFGIVRFIKSLLNHEAVHAEHTAYYSGKTLSRLMQMSKMRVVRMGYYVCEPLTIFDWNRAVSNIIENSMCAIWPQYSEGLIVEVKCAA